MRSSENSDEVPVADAVEQQQDTVPPPMAPDREDPPIEADGADWQEQRQQVGDDDYPM